MKCPHCRTAIHESMKTVFIDKDIEAHWFAVSQICPECKKLVVMLGAARNAQPPGMIPVDMRSTYLVRPKTTARNPLPPEVPKEFSEDYNEAGLVLSDSPKASAALARRCLQNLAHDGKLWVMAPGLKFIHPGGARLNNLQFFEPFIPVTVSPSDHVLGFLVGRFNVS